MKLFSVHSRIDTFSEKWSNVVPANLKIDKLASGFAYADSPLYLKNGNVLVADILRNKIYTVNKNGKSTVFLNNSGGIENGYAYQSEMIGSSGMILNKDDHLLLCQQGSHAIVCLKESGAIEKVVDSYGEKPFNSPNDIVTSSDGAIYFTDPPYGLSHQLLQPGKFQSFSGVYCYNHSSTTLLTSSIRNPDGICLSKNEKYLFVSSNHPDEPYIWKFTLGEQHKVIAKEIFIQQNADGIISDASDNIYLASGKGIMVVSPEGKRMALIHLPEFATNICWGDHTAFSLYATTHHSLYQIHQ